MELTSAALIELSLQRVGELIAFEGDHYAIVVIGGAALNLLGIVERATRDVDILAFANRISRSRFGLQEPPRPIPVHLARAIATVGRDMSLDDDWMNIGPALQWRQGLPQGIEDRVQWRHYGPSETPDLGLEVGVVDRYDLVFFKLYATVDHHSPASVHCRDLLALTPSDEELDAAVDWLRTQDPSPAFSLATIQAVDYVKHQLARGK